MNSFVERLDDNLPKEAFVNFYESINLKLFMMNERHRSILFGIQLMLPFSNTSFLNSFRIK